MSTKATKRPRKNGSKAAKKSKNQSDSDLDNFSDGDAPASPASSGGDDLKDLEENAAPATEDELAKHLGPPGTVILSGCMSWDSTGKDGRKSSLPFNCLWSPMKFGCTLDMKVCKVITGRQACHTVLITNEGKTWVMGRNALGQLGTCDTKTRNIPVLVDTLKESTVINAACGKTHTLFLTINGTVFGCGGNSCGQLGIGATSPSVLVPTRVNMKGRKVVKLACGNEFSMLVDKDGELYGFGSPEYGQCGNNTDGQYFVTSGKLAFNYVTSPRRITLFLEKDKDGRQTALSKVFITDVSCGINHCAALDDLGRVFTWGFGGYGRLGHSVQNDEKVPRLLKQFEGPQRGALKIWCGGSCTFVLNKSKMLYMMGKVFTSSNKEANMYPGVVQDLTGWNINCLAACDHAVTIAADNNLIVMGGGKTYGELALGEGRKSSANYDTVRSMDGIRISDIGLGLGHMVAVVQQVDEEMTKKVAKMGTWTPKCP